MISLTLVLAVGVRLIIFCASAAAIPRNSYQFSLSE
jgi:hypothetical protein